MVITHSPSASGTSACFTVYPFLWSWWLVDQDVIFSNASLCNYGLQIYANKNVRGPYFNDNSCKFWSSEYFTVQQWKTGRNRVTRLVVCWYISVLLKYIKYFRTLSSEQLPNSTDEGDIILSSLPLPPPLSSPLIGQDLLRLNQSQPAHLWIWHIYYFHFLFARFCARRNYQNNYFQKLVW